jgi:hypothetical protein
MHSLTHPYFFFCGVLAYHTICSRSKLLPADADYSMHAATCIGCCDEERTEATKLGMMSENSMQSKLFSSVPHNQLSLNLFIPFPVSSLFLQDIPKHRQYHIALSRFMAE